MCFGRCRNGPVHRRDPGLEARRAHPHREPPRHRPDGRYGPHLPRMLQEH